MTSLDAARVWPVGSEGLRRFDPARDLRDVVELLKTGFGADLDPRDQRWLNELAAMSGAGPFFGWILKVVPAAENVFSGFIWQVDGRVVANASLMRATPRVWIIANVVTHPDWRRRGLARRVVEAAIEAAYAHGAQQVQLQVRHDNSAALAMYRALGFKQVLATTSLRLVNAHFLLPLAGAGTGAELATWGRSSRRWVEEVLARAEPLEGLPPGLVRQALARQGPLAALGDWIGGVRRYKLAVRHDIGFGAVGAALANAVSGTHGLEVVTDPRCRGQVEAPLVSELLAHLARHRPLEIEAEVRDSEAGVQAALLGAGFRPVRTLVRMSLPLKGFASAGKVLSVG